MVEDDGLFTKDEKLWTSAGVLAGVDMALAMMQEDLGNQPKIWLISGEISKPIFQRVKRQGIRFLIESATDADRLIVSLARTRLIKLIS